nr:chemotaxis protein CheW [Pseudenhygromyxa sp. WMMC2535]
MCRSAGAERLAIPLAEVSRLEEIHASRVERMGPQEVIQHNEEIVPLVRLSRLLGGELGAGARAEAPGEIGGELDRLQLVIHRVDGRPAGSSSTSSSTSSRAGRRSSAPRLARGCSARW